MLEKLAVNDLDKIEIGFPDGYSKEFPAGTTGREIAESISASLAKAAVAVETDGTLTDLNTPVTTSCTIRIIRREDDEALELIRHDAAHVMAQAVQELFPGTQVTIGPTIENGFYYDFAREEPFSTEDLESIEQRMHEIVDRGEKFVCEFWNRNEATKYFRDKGEEYKAELIEDLPESEQIKIYRQGEWLDLCRGPHLPSTKDVGHAFKLTGVAGAYWRGDSSRAMLNRIYGTAWRNEKELKEYLTMMEEAEKRDHRRLGREMDLFHFQEEAVGQVFWHAKGWQVYLSLIEYMRGKLHKYNYIEVNTPQMLDSRFWQASGHWDKYRENMFLIQSEDQEHLQALKPMSCPGNVQLYKSTQKSYRDLPVRMAEFGHVIRHEPSGSRHGLMRVQAFTQDDAHIFCADEQLEDEVVAMCDLIREVYTDLGIADDITVYFSTRPEMRIGTDEDWDRAEDALRKVLDRINMKWVLNEGDGAFYAPKLDFMVRDAIGRQWQCGTIQVDMNMPRRMEMYYTGEDGEKHIPHMVHRAILGSVERFLGVLIEHYAGKLPLWLAPVQCVVATITSDADDYARQLHEELRSKGIRVETDLRNEKINYKVREHSVKKIPALFVVGKREAKEGKVAIRRLGEKEQPVLEREQAVSDMIEKSRPPY
jgi:threonyl-tRNA synthetase